MKLKPLFNGCREMTFDAFKTKFRLITEENLELVLQNFGYEGHADFITDTGLEPEILIGLLTDVTYGELYSKPLPGDPLNIIIDASNELYYRTPPNIDEDVNYEDCQVCWFMGGTMGTRFIPHSLKEYFEPEGEGDTQMTHRDYWVFLSNMMDAQAFNEQ